MARRPGQTLTEYALALMLIGLLVVGAINLIGGTVDTTFSSVNGNMSADGGSGGSGGGGGGGEGPTFTWNPTPPVAFSDVSFDGPSSSAFYSWDFNDDGTPDSTIEDPVVTFPASGTYMVALSTDAGSVTLAVEVHPFTGRLYPSGHGAGDSGSPQSQAAPNLGSSSLSSSWEVWGGNFGVNMMYTSPMSSIAQGTGTGSANWMAVNAGERDAAVMGYLIRLDDPALLALVQTGGTIKAQFLTGSRHGVGVSEASQNNVSAFDMRVWRPSTGTVVGTALDVTTVGEITWPAQSTKINRTFEQTTFSGVPGALSSDYLYVTIGSHHITPISGGTGVALPVNDSAAEDLPEDNTTTGSYNSWIELSSH